MIEKDDVNVFEYSSSDELFDCFALWSKIWMLCTRVYYKGLIAFSMLTHTTKIA